MMTDIILSNVNQIPSIVNAFNLLNFNYEWVITIKRKVKNRTNSQNNLYWKWIGEVAKHVSDLTGYEIDEVHTLFKENFLDGKKVCIGNKTSILYSTKLLTTKEMSDYMERIQRFCVQDLELLVTIPAELQRHE
jgi:hypothetical protein